MKRKPDTTGKSVASLSAAILGADQIVGGFNILSGKTWRVIRVRDLVAMAGSLVNQAPDKPKKKRGKR